MYVVILAALNVFFLFRQRLYSFAWEFVSLRELAKLLKAITFASTVFALIVFLGLGNTELFAGFPRSVIFINYALNLIFIGSVRIAKRTWQEVVKKQPVSQAPRALIVGADVEGERLIRNLVNTTKSYPFMPIGIVDHRKEKVGTKIHDIEVMGTIEDIPKSVRDHNVEYVIISLASADAHVIREAVKQAREANVKHIRIIPDTHELLSGRVTLTDLREIQIEDLLGRNPAHIETEKISEFIRGKVVMITGAAGSIGRELARQAAAFEPTSLVLVDFNESDLYDLHAELSSTLSHEHLKPVIANINNRGKIFTLVKEFKPHIIFHAAAYKHVPLMEEFPDEAVETNIFGTLNVAEAALEANVHKFVLVSTDKAIRPVSVMGKTKRVAELIVQELNEQAKTKFVSVRFGNVIGSRGSVVPLFKEQIKRRAPITITHPDMTRYFMTIQEAALLVMEAGAVGGGGEIFMLDMGKPVKIEDLAKEMIRLAGLRPDVDIPLVFTGIRPGEKIFEEIFSADEKQVGKTQWDKIFITKNNYPNNSAPNKERLAALKESLINPSQSIERALDRFSEPKEN